MDQLCKRMRERWSIAAITNDIYTREDAEFLMRSQALPLDRIIGVETGGCPHTAIREDASINLAAVDELEPPLPRPRPDPDRVRRRQPLGHLLARARRPHALRHRRLRPATRSRARAAPASPAPTCSSSTRSTSRPTSAPRSRSWTATPPDARRAAVPVRPGPRRRRRAGDRRLHRDARAASWCSLTGDQGPPWSAASDGNGRSAAVMALTVYILAAHASRVRGGVAGARRRT